MRGEKPYGGGAMKSSEGVILSCGLGCPYYQKSKADINCDLSKRTIHPMRDLKGGLLFPDWCQLPTNRRMQIGSGPILDNHYPQRCEVCGRDGFPYWGNVPPAVIMNYMLLNHASYLRGAVIKNIYFLNSVLDTSKKMIMLKDW